MIEQVKQYMHLIADYSKKETEVGAVLEDALNASGKMFRTKLLLFCASLGPCYEEKKEKLCKLAAMVELTHLASLIHDDIVDDSPYRRGKISIQGKYGKDAAVYAGDFLMARIYYYEAVERLNESAALLSKTVEHMCTGEIGQDLCRYREDVSVEEYFQNIQGKTAALFETACHIGAMEAGCSQEMIEKLKLFGRNLGMMFQLKDDILDFTSDMDEIGKETHKDFQNGIYTFPVIKALENKQAKEILYPIMEKNKGHRLDDAEITKMENCVLEYRGVEATYQEIQSLSKKNKQILQEIQGNQEAIVPLWKLMDELEA